MELNRDYKNIKYQNGFGNHFVSEALPNVLPKAQNNPQKCNYNLYAEQLSGSPFTAPRSENQFSWLYRIIPSAKHSQFKKSQINQYIQEDIKKISNPNQLRWKPLPLKILQQKNFVQGIIPLGVAGSPQMKDGITIYVYHCNTSMRDSAFQNSDGNMLIVPQQGDLHIITEFGKMTIGQQEICVIQKGIRFSVEVQEECRGWIAEVYNNHFKLPELGPIGANGLANARDFQYPVAFYERVESKFTIYNKFINEMFECEQDHSCFDVVGWHGKYSPYKYDLRNFCCMNTVTFDHPDPSIFTVLTCGSDQQGTAICDFVIFPPRWMVSENTFRPPYYHRNCMTEFMGNILGQYDAKEEGFNPGCSSLHSMMTPHGPESLVFEKASNMELKPVKMQNSLAFMFETCYQLKLTSFVMDDILKLDQDYYQCWTNLKDNFTQ